MTAVAEQGESVSKSGDGLVGRIPVRNLWLLMLYASELFRVKGKALAGWEESPDDLPDLIARFLAEAVELRQRRNLSFGYRRRDAILHRVRGRINLLSTERQQLLERGLIACHFNELTVDTPRNRYVLAALESISRMVSQEVAHKCRTLARAMKAMGVSSGSVNRSQMSLEQFGRNDAQDKVMVIAARLAFEFALLNEAAGIHTLPSPDREERLIRDLFEKAVGGFYRVALSPDGWCVQQGKWLDWQIDKQTPGIAKILQKMKTDIELNHQPSSRRIVIDTKFASILTKGRSFQNYQDREVIRNSYLFQIYAYLHSQIGRGDLLADNASGLVLHPSIGEMVDETVVIQGRAIRFATVDLTAEPKEIREQLLRLCEAFSLNKLLS